MNYRINPEKYDKATKAAPDSVLAANEILIWLQQITKQKEDVKSLIDSGEVEPW
jgi:hypothetical protein